MFDITIHWNDVTYGNGKFVTVGEGVDYYGYYTTSIDGENWTTPEQIKNESGNALNIMIGMLFMSYHSLGITA